jgi:hypothetical protein
MEKSYIKEFLMVLYYNVKTQQKLRKLYKKSTKEFMLHTYNWAFNDQTNIAIMVLLDDYGK